MATQTCYPRVEILGGTIASVDMTLGLAFVTYYGTQFSVDGSDVTSTLTPGVPVEVGADRYALWRTRRRHGILLRFSRDVWNHVARAGAGMRL